MRRWKIRKVVYFDTIFRRPWGENQHLCRLECGHTRTVEQGPKPKRAACFECGEIVR